MAFLKKIFIILSITFTVQSLPTKQNSYPEQSGKYFQGDILIQDAVDNGLLDQSKWWPDGIVPYEFTGEFSKRDMEVIQKAMDHYKEFTCITFRPKTDEDVAYVSIQNEQDGCYSYVGRTGGKQVLNLESPFCSLTIGTPVHEMMHALGFFHEQSRSDRDDYVTIEWDNIEPGEERQFAKFDPDKISAFGVEYDYGSVMHYQEDAFSVNGEPTIVPKVSYLFSLIYVFH